MEGMHELHRGQCRLVCDLDSDMLRLELEERARGCVGTSSLDAQHGSNLLLSYILHSFCT